MPGKQENIPHYAVFKRTNITTTHKLKQLYAKNSKKFTLATQKKKQNKFKKMKLTKKKMIAALSCCIRYQTMMLDNFGILIGVIMTDQ